MKAKNQDIANAREEHQRENMQALSDAGKCLFCPDGLPFAEKQPIFRGEFWYVKPNDYPYEGAVTHVMAVPNRHIMNPEELTQDELFELFQVIIPWLRTELEMEGLSCLFRFGNTKRTGATIHHLHVHFIEGAERSSSSHPPIFAVVGFKTINSNNS